MIPGTLQLNDASELELRLLEALRYVETKLGCGVEQTSLASALSDGVRQLQGFRLALEAIVEDASPCSTACHSIVRDSHIEKATELVGK